MPKKQRLLFCVGKESLSCKGRWHGVPEGFYSSPPFLVIASEARQSKASTGKGRCPAGTEGFFLFLATKKATPKVAFLFQSPPCPAGLRTYKGYFEKQGISCVSIPAEFGRSYYLCLRPRIKKRFLGLNPRRIRQVLLHTVR